MSTAQQHDAFKLRIKGEPAFFLVRPCPVRSSLSRDGVGLVHQTFTTSLPLFQLAQSFGREVEIVLASQPRQWLRRPPEIPVVGNFARQEQLGIGRTGLVDWRCEHFDTSSPPRSTLPLAVMIRAYAPNTSSNCSTALRMETGASSFF